MDEVIRRFNKAGVRYLVIGGQAARLAGVPRFSMDWDIFVPPRDAANFMRINEVLGDELDVSVVALGERGENYIQTYQTRWGIIQFHLGCPGLRDFDEAEGRSVVRLTETGLSVQSLSDEDLLASKKAANRPEDALDIEFLEIKTAELKEGNEQKATN